jgi:3-keto-L-gulonate-6-phosphate decarboxylase
MPQTRRKTRLEQSPQKRNRSGTIPPVQIALDLIDLPRAIQIARETAQTARKYHVKLVTDLISVRDPPKRAIELERLGVDIIKYKMTANLNQWKYHSFFSFQ